MYIRHVYIRRTRMKMAMSHSGHLFAVALFIFGLCAPYFRDSLAHDFTSSRQFRKNLAVSKYRNDTYWLPNYHWTPPEKYYGPRKKPAWEDAEETTQQDKGKTRQQQEWEEKMREISRQEREKWKTYRKDTESTSADDDDEESQSSGKFVQPEESRTVSTVSEEEGDEEEGSGSGSLENNEDLSNSPSEYSLSEATNSSTDERDTESRKTSGVEKEQPKGKLKQDTVRKKSGTIDEQQERTSAMQEGRWGMEVKNPPQEFLRVVSGIGESDGEHRKSGKKTTRKSNSRRTLSPSEIHGNGFAEEFQVKRRKSVGEPKDELEHKDTTERSVYFPKNRWGMSGTRPPRGFLNDVAQSLTLRAEETDGGADNEAFKARGSTDLPGKPRPEVKNRRKTKGMRKKTSGKTDEELARVNEARLNSVASANSRRSSMSEKKGKDSRGKENANPEEIFRAGRWGMSVSRAPLEFLRDLSGRSNGQKASKPRSSAPEKTRWGTSASGPPKEFSQDVNKRREDESVTRQESPRSEQDVELEKEIMRSFEKAEQDRSKENLRQENSVNTGEEVHEDYDEESGPSEKEEYVEKGKGKKEAGRKMENGRSSEMEEKLVEKEAETDPNLFATGRWGMSVNSPPREFLKDLSRRSNRQMSRQSSHRKNTRWGMSVSNPPEEFLEDISRNRRKGTHRPAKSWSMGNLAPNRRAYEPAATEISAEARRKMCENLPVNTNAENSRLIDKMCREIRGSEEEKESSRNSVERVREKIGQWPNMPGNVDANNVYVQRGMSLLLKMIQQGIDPRAKFVHVPVVCRTQRVPLSSFL